MKSEKIKSVPELRFPGFDGAWNRIELEAIASKKISYGIVQAGEHVPGGMPYIKSQDLNKPLDIDSLQRTSSEIARKYRRSEVEPGDIVFSLRGNIGVSQIVPSSIAVANLTQGTARIAVKNHDNRLVAQTLQTENVARDIDACAKGSTFREISLESLRKVSLPLAPTLLEQQKIADFLTVVDGRIAQLSRKKALLEDYKKGVMQQLFTQALRFKDDDGNEFPDWEEKTLGEVLTIGSGRDYKHLDKGNIPVYGSGGVMAFVNNFLYKGESVCIGRKGTIDKPRLVRGAFWTVDTLFYTHSFKNVLPRFVYAIFQRINWQAYNEASGVPSLSKTTIESIPVSIPHLEEQTKIANFLTALDRKIESVAAQITHNQTWKKGLLQQMFV
ncbi:hypothetical protein GCM10023213_31360 [Prosthecobacter algae]|uniref:Type I restriction modification DNA specificity domain-containing protein n=1 Tax=Prosthecobacter algae TaxID=1144682 RepID=A0ABP9PBJ0_9BACT